MKDLAKIVAVSVVVCVLTVTLMRPAEQNGPPPQPQKRTFVERVKRFFVIWWLTKAEHPRPRYKANPSDRIQNEEPIQQDFVDHGHGW